MISGAIQSIQGTSVNRNLWTFLFFYKTLAFFSLFFHNGDLNHGGNPKHNKKYIMNYDIHTLSADEQEIFVKTIYAWCPELKELKV